MRKKGSWRKHPRSSRSRSSPWWCKQKLKEPLKGIAKKCLVCIGYFSPSNQNQQHLEGFYRQLFRRIPGPPAASQMLRDRSWERRWSITHKKINYRRVVSARKAISSSSSRKLKPIHYDNIFGYFPWNKQCHLLFFFKLCYYLNRAHFGEGTYEWVPNLLTLWLSKTLGGEWKRNKTDFWVSFVSNFVFLVCLFFSRFVFHL